MGSTKKIVISFKMLKVILKVMSKRERVTLNLSYKGLSNKISYNGVCYDRIDSINHFQGHQMRSAKTGKIKIPEDVGTPENKGQNKREQKNLLITIMRQDEDLGLYSL